MNNLHTILNFLPNYKILLFFSGLTSILYITFNALSLWLVSSLLSMIFNAELIIKNESIDRIYTYLSNYNQLNQIKILSLLIFGAFILKNIFYLLNHYSLSYIKNNIIRNLRSKLYNHFNDYFGGRIISICRELTKIYEETFLGTAEDAIEYFSKSTPKGEFVLLIAKNGYKLD